MVTTSLKTPPKILVIGQKDVLTTQLIRALEKRGCQVFFPKKLTLPSVKINYIFQLSHFDKAREVLEKAIKDNSRYLLVEESLGVSDEERRVVENEIFAFKDKIDCRILRIERITFANTAAIAKQILKEMFGRKRALLPQPVRSDAKQTNKQERKKKKTVRPQLSFPKFKINAFLFLVLFVLLSFPYLFFGINVFLGAKNLQSFEKNFFAGDLAKARKNSTSAQNFFKQGQKFNTLVPFLKTGKKIAFFGETISQTGVSSVRIAKIGHKIAGLILGREEGEVEERLDQLKIETESLEREIALTEVLYQDINPEAYQGIIPSFLDEKLKKIPVFLSSGKEFCLLVKKSLPLVNEMIQSGTYLFLFKNNMELRPGGGFIGSYGLARFEKGELVKFETHDVYSADGQLKGHVEPPAAIRKYLDQPHFFLRDSNWSSDFAVNAQKAAWFLKKEIDQEVDGVISVDLSFVQKTLEVLGGIYLVDYQQEITSENLFLKAQTLIQGGFFPGSTQKRDFLGALARAILNQAKLGGLPWFSTAKSLKQALEEKHIQIFSFDQKAQKLVEELGWGGRLPVVSCRLPVDGCFPDYLMIVEANLGVNKANYFVKREINLETDFSQEEVVHELSVSYQNSSPGKTFPGGTYKNYLRVFVPEKAVLRRLAFKGKEIPVKQVETEKEEDKQSWGVLLEIPPGETGKIEFKYRLNSQKTFADKQFSYELFFQKQAGTEKDSLFLKFNYPKNWQVKKTNFPAFVHNNSLNYTSDLSVDRIFSIDF